MFGDAEMELVEVSGRVYVVHVLRHLTRGLLARALATIWAAPSWRQPWGLVLVMRDGVTYDGDVRKHEMPPDDRRAVGTAVVTASQLHRMVINSVGLGYRTMSRFVVSAHDTLEAAIEAQSKLVVSVEAARRRF